MYKLYCFIFSKHNKVFKIVNSRAFLFIPFCKSPFEISHPWHFPSQQHRQRGEPTSMRHLTHCERNGKPVSYIKRSPHDGLTSVDLNLSQLTRQPPRRMHSTTVYTFNPHTSRFRPASSRSTFNLPATSKIEKKYDKA